MLSPLAIVVAAPVTVSYTHLDVYKRQVIDTALIQPGLSDTQRANLWGQRVDTLQQLVGIETTNRLYASRGQTYDVALVSID